MPTIQSKLDTNSSDFNDNREKMMSLVDELKDKINLAAEGGGERSRKKHLSRDKLLPRDRIKSFT